MSVNFTLAASSRTVLGKGVRKLRRQKILPAVIYSSKVPSLPIQLKLSEFLSVFKQARETNVIQINLEDRSYNCLIHDVDLHPYKNEIRHVDFLAVDLKEKITTNVPLKFVGQSEAAKNSGAVLITNLDEIKVECLPDKIPDFIEVDLSLLKTLDDVIYVSDLPQTTDYVILEDPHQAVAVLGQAKTEGTDTENSENSAETNT